MLDAFEAFSDCDGDSINDRCQIAGDPPLDLNANGILDSCDIASGTSEDENSNGIPDENEPALRFVSGSRVIGSGVEDGRSWATAYASLDAVLDDAADRLAPTEVWVAGGVYTPTGFGAGRSRAFHVRGDTTLLGGFAGDEEHADQRDPVANPTILSGDFKEDDTDGGTNEENALHVVIGPAFGEHAILDGFIIERGNADLFDSSLMISGFSNFPGYWPDAAGGGVLGMSGDLTMRGCVVRSNRARLGGAAIHAGPASYWDGSNVGVVSLTLADTAFEDNTFEYQDGFSAFAASCVFSAARSIVDIDRCSFIGNAGGSAISIRGVVNSPDIFSTGYTASAPFDLRNSLLVANDSILSTGSVLALVSGSGANQNNFHAVNNTIAYNNSRGISVPPQGLLANSIIWGNTGDSGATETDQVSINATGSVRNTIVEGWTGTLPGTHVSVSGADPMFADALSGDLRLLPGSPAIDAGDNNPLALAVLDDLDGNDRFVNDCATPDTGVPDGLRPLVDLGAYEFQAASIMGDANGDGVVDVTDLNLVLSAWMTSVDTPGLGGDVSRDGFVDMDDLNQVLRRGRVNANDAPRRTRLIRRQRNH
ncbi:MAG: choice-of-anchor Q domain-containing protein [Phycisphaerales bacterium]